MSVFVANLAVPPNQSIKPTPTSLCFVAAAYEPRSIGG